MQNEPPALAVSDFGMLLRQYRVAAGLSQEELAERARMSANGVGSLERGYRRTPQRETLALLAGALTLTDEQRHAFEAAAAPVAFPRRAPAGPWPDTLVAPLPLALTTFVGRERELREIATLVREHRLVTLTGAGGVGKTQTASHVAMTLSEANDGTGVRFIPFAPLGDASLVTAAIASALGVPEVPNRPLIETLLAFLKTKSLLLIFDNCEHVVEEAAAVAAVLLTGCPRVRILATSREPLKSAGEFTYRVPSLDVPSSIALFTDRSRAVDYHFTIADDEVPLVTELCRRLDGIPLAIELAAARVNVLSIKALLEKLNDRFRLLTVGGRTALDRHQTMRAAIDWSYDLCFAQERCVFERLSVFAGGCTLADAALVCIGQCVKEADIFGLLSSLIDKSLVSMDFDGTDERYRLLESFREYASEKLAMRGEQHVIARRHALAALAAAERLNVAYGSQPDEVWNELARKELDNWRAALQWSLTNRGDVLLGQRLVGELNVIWQFFAPIEGRRWIASAFESAGEQTPTGVLARLDYIEATIAWVFHENALHLTSSQRALARYRAVGDSLGIARALCMNGHALLTHGRVEEALPLMQEALAMARKLGDRRLLAYTVRFLGWAASVHHGDILAAREQITEALQIYKALGAKLSAAYSLDDLGEAEFCAGNVEAALHYATEALAIVRSFNDMPLMASQLDGMSGYLVALGRYDEAQERILEVLDLARELHLEVRVGYALQHLAALAALRQYEAVEVEACQHQGAAKVLGYADARFQAMGAARLRNQEQQEYDRILVALYGALGPQALADLMAAGAAMTEDQAVEAALSLCIPGRAEADG